MYILGISCFYHDAAACLIKNGKLIAAASEERFTRKKYDDSLPRNAIQYCLKQEGISIKDIEYIGFYDKPFIKFERILSTYLSVFPRGLLSFYSAIPIWLKQKLWTPYIIRKELNYSGKIIFIEHHMSHAASSFLVSPFEKAAILTVDGVGEWTTASKGIGDGNKIDLTHEIHFPHSLGLLYAAFTSYLGFRINSAEYKVMGLASYGKPVYYDLIKKEIIDIKEDGSFKLNMKYFAYHYGLVMTSKKFHKLFDGPPREVESEVTEKHQNIAASLQKVTNEIMIKLANSLYKETGFNNLCLAGGVALNCVANGEILEKTPFKNIFIQPAAGDAGGAIGVAFYIWNTILNNPREFEWSHNYWGPQFSNEGIRQFLIENNIPYQKLDFGQIAQKTANLIAKGNIIGWFQGRMEWGPRALGDRSVLADPRNKDIKSLVNKMIKFREEFRPFAPSMLEEYASDYLEMKTPSPYMLFTTKAKENKKDIIPAVVHVDGSSRHQTVNRDQNQLYYDLINEFYKITKVSVVLNTSFNLRSEPIVCTPSEAYLCFMRSGLDYLVLGNYLLDKKNQLPLQEGVDWRKIFQPD
jgi:carbamoyltransferase